MKKPGRHRSREDYERGLPDYHDPTAGLGGAAPAQSALTLRLVLAVFGLVVCVAGGIGFLAAGLPVWAAVVLFVLGAVALVDIGVVVRRKARGEPG
jgi:membrane protein implicated in regulation of membrane protease activity